MDPMAVLQSRIEQLEAKLGFTANAVSEGHQGDSASSDLLSVAQAVNNGTMGHKKLSEAMPMASELNNYTDPSFVEMSERNNKNIVEGAAVEPVLRPHCQCAHRCKQAGPVLESEPTKQVPEMQAAVDQTLGLASTAVEVTADAEACLGVQEVAEGGGAAGAEGSAAAEPASGAAQQVHAAEQKLFPRRRNGLD